MTLTHLAKRTFRKLTPAEVAATELAEAELQKLEAQTAQEYATSMVGYHTQRISRLRAFLKAQGETGEGRAAP